MAELSVAILGLGRIGVSTGLRLKQYTTDGGKHQFNVVGYDMDPVVRKQAEKLNAIDRAESQAYKAVQDVDLVVLALSYEEVKAAYETIAADLRDGVVILDASPLKMPSLQWADKFLGDEHHVVGITPIINPKRLFENDDTIDGATVDFFKSGSMLLTPSVSCIKEAIDLAVNFSVILGASPHFLDPVEHDNLIAFTEGLSSVLSVATFYSLLMNDGWGDIQRLTNPTFAAMTRHLFSVHPDALRDQWVSNRDNLVRGLDSLVTTLQDVRQLLASDDRAAIEALLTKSSEEYEKWINRRHQAKWDEDVDKRPGLGNSMMSSLLGGALTKRLMGDDDDEKDKR